MSFSIAAVVNRIIRRRRLYALRSTQLVVLACTAWLASWIYRETDAGTFRTTTLALIFVIALWWITKRERAWLGAHRMPILGSGALPDHGPTRKRGKGKPSTPEFRGAHWRSLWDLWYRYRWRPGSSAIRLGRLAPEQRMFGFFFPGDIGFAPSRHVLIVAPTRAGKGTMGIVPNLLTLPNPAMVVDPKGELARITAARRGKGRKQFPASRVTHSLNQDVFVFDPYNTTRGLHNASFNPLDEVDPTAPTAIAMVGAIVRSIFPDDAEGKDDKTFREQARAFIEAVILHVLTVEAPANRSLVRVWQLVTQGDVEFLGLLRESAEAEGIELEVTSPIDALYTAMAHNEAFEGTISAMGRFMLDLVPETRDGILFTARPELDFLKDPQMQACLKTSAFRLSSLFLSKTTIYLCLPVTKVVGQQRRVLLMFINMLLEVTERVERPSEHPFVFIDELPSLGYIESIERAMGLVKYRFTLVPIFQDVSQIRKLYKEAWENFVANCSVIALRVGNPETARWLSERIGIVYKGAAAEPLIAAHELQGPFSDDSDRRIIFDDGVPAILEGVPYMESFPRTAYDEP